MVVLVSALGIAKAYGSDPLFEGIHLSLHKGERLGIVGPNGCGKSSLLKIFAGLLTPDEGEVVRRQGCRVALVPQVGEYPDLPLESCLLETIFQRGGRERGEEEWLAVVRSMLGKMGFSREQHVAWASSLSGGWRRRLDLARALLLEPDLLLLDEPTHHLDFSSMDWLESMLRRLPCAYVVVSHDRCFLDHVVDAVFEINRLFPSGYFFCEGNYTVFAEKRADFMATLLRQREGLQGKVRLEEEWLRQSPQARTTKQQARIQRAGELQEALDRSRKLIAKKPLPWSFSSGEIEARKLLVAKNLGKKFGFLELFAGLSFTLSPGSCLAIVGDNGSGKSTLLKILAGEVAADVGTVKYAEGARVVYFDQYRELLPLEVSLRDSLSPNGDTLLFQGKEIHVHGWARRFGFSEARLSLPLSVLSGGERARLLLARFMLKPADILLLDEPTHDLDFDHLELLEGAIKMFPGGILLVTHDRRLIERVATAVLGLGAGHDSHHFADYEQWHEARRQSQMKVKKGEESVRVRRTREAKKTLSYREQKELDGLPDLIEEVERKESLLHTQIESWASTEKSQELFFLCQEAKTLEEERERLYRRWQELTALSCQ